MIQSLLLMFDLKLDQESTGKVVESFANHNFLDLMTIISPYDGNFGINLSITENSSPIRIYLELVGTRDSPESIRFRMGDYHEQSQPSWPLRKLNDYTQLNGQLYLSQEKDDQVQQGHLALEEIIIDYPNGERIPHNVNGTKEPEGTVYPTFMHGEEGNVRVPTDDIDRVRYWVPEAVSYTNAHAHDLLFELANRDQDFVATERGLEEYYHGPLQLHPQRGVLFHMTGTYIAENHGQIPWSDYSTEEIRQSLTQHAKEITSAHFTQDLLPSIVDAGHDRASVEGAFYSNRSSE